MKSYEIVVNVWTHDRTDYISASYNGMTYLKKENAIMDLDKVREKYKEDPLVEFFIQEVDKCLTKI